MTLGMVSAVIAAVALGGYFAGKRERVAPPQTAVPTTTATTAGTTTAATATTATATTAPSASAVAPAPSALPSATPSSQASGAAVAPESGKVHRRVRRVTPAPVDSAAEPKPDLPAPPVPENPFDP